MTYKRLLVIIAVVGFLGLVTTWQQIQTMRWGYSISEANEMKKRLLEEQKNLEVKLSSVVAPQSLFALVQKRGIAMDYRSGPNMVKTSDNLHGRQALRQRFASRISGNQNRAE